MTAVSPEEERIVNLMSVSATYTLIEDAVQNLDATAFDDDEIAALASLQPAHRMKLVARLVELTEAMRRAQQRLDFRVLQLTS